MESAALAAAGGGPPGLDQEAVERCNSLWESAERFAAELPKKTLPRFRALVAPEFVAPCPDSSAL